MTKNKCEKLGMKHAWRELGNNEISKFCEKIYDEYASKKDFSHTVYIHVKKCLNCKLENVNAEFVYVKVIQKYSDGEVR